MNSNLINFFKNFLKSPVKILGFVVIVLSLVLLFGCQFHVPDYYTDKILANQIAQTVSPKEVSKAVEHLVNKKYFVFNPIFKLWGICTSAFLFTLILKINEFKRFKNIEIFNNKRFVYLWINLSYPIWGFCYTLSYMQDIEKYVYNGSADSFGIPFFDTISLLISLGIVYYPCVNLLAFVTYNTKITRWVYNIFWGLAMFAGVLLIIDSSDEIFSCFIPFMYFIYIIWFMLIIYAIGYMKNKKQTLLNQK